MLVLFGVGGHVAERMTSILPSPKGTGKRNNKAKREYVLLNLIHIEYRTIAFRTHTEAKEFEKTLKAKKTEYLFGT